MLTRSQPVFGGRVISAQDKYTVSVPGGLAFSEFRGYEGWQTISLSRNEQAGRLNKQVGGELGICEITVKTHRARIMRKMKAGSFADLVRMESKLRPAALP